VTRIESWLKKVAARDAARPRFDDALITDRGAGYAVYRLKFLSVRMLLRAALHLAEIVLFSSVFSMGFLAPVIIVRSLMALVVSLWWGGLEEMREEVRGAAEKKQWGTVRRVIDAWMSFGLLSGTGMAVLGTLIVLANVHEVYGLSVYNAYLIACFLRLGLDVIARTWHSGAFAIRRIYRPMWSLLLTDFFDVALVVALWTTLFVWGFSVSLLFVGILRFALLVFFVRRTYAESPIPPMRFFRMLPALVRLPARSVGRFFIHAAANLSSQIDTLLIMALVALSSSREDGFVLALTLYLLRPFMAAGYSWGRLFYFDFVLLKKRYGDFLRQRFLRFMKKTALAYGAVTALLGIAWTGWVLPLFMAAPPGNSIHRQMVTVAVLLLPFILVRSLFGLHQMQAFSFGRYGYLLRLTAASLLCIGPCVLLVEHPIALLLLLTVVIALLVVAFPAPGPQKPEIVRQHLSIPAWFAALRAVEGQVVAGVLRIDRRLVPVARVMGFLAKRFPGLRLARLDRNGLLFFGDASISSRELITASGGVLTHLNIVVPGVDAASAIPAMGDVWRSHFSCASAYCDGDSLIAAFSARFPDGDWLNVNRGKVKRRGREGVSPATVRRVLRTVSRADFSSLMRRFPAGNFDLSVFAPGGIPAVVFMIPSTVPVSERAAWAQVVHQAGVEASLIQPTTRRGPGVSA